MNLLGQYTFSTPDQESTEEDPSTWSPIVQGSHTPVFEAFVVSEYQTTDEPDGVPIEVHGGDVTLDATADIRGTLDITVIGQDRQTGRPLWPRTSSDLLNPFGTEIFVRRGIDLGDSTIWSPLGYYRIDTLEQTGLADARIAITGQDRMAGLVDGKPLTPREYQPHTSVGGLVADLVGDIYPSAVVLFDDETPFAQVGRTVVVEDSRYDALREVADAFGKLMYWDGSGALRFEDAPDERDPVWIVNAGENGVLVEPKRRISREETYNAVVAAGEGGESDTSPVRAVAADVGPHSPTRWGGRFGRRPLFYTSPLIHTQAQAMQAAHQILRRRLGAQFNVDFTARCNPALRPWHTVRIVHSDGTRDLHSVESVIIPLDSVSHMEATTREKTLVSIGALPGSTQ